MDPNPVPGGNIEFDPDNPRLIRVVRAEKHVERYMSHYVTCPDAERYRARQGVKLAVSK